MPNALPSLQPDLRLFGTVDESMLGEFLRQQAEAPRDKPLVLELSTAGGDADVGRRIAQEIRQWRHEGTSLYCFGKSYVYSAGASILAAFERDQRFLSSDCELLVHERKMQKELRLDGALRACSTQVKNMLAEIESGQRLERESFAELVKGSRPTLKDIEQRVCDRDWCLNAHEALELGLVGGLVPPGNAR